MRRPGEDGGPGVQPGQAKARRQRGGGCGRALATSGSSRYQKLMLLQYLEAIVRASFVLKSGLSEMKVTVRPLFDSKLYHGLPFVSKQPSSMRSSVPFQLQT